MKVITIALIATIAITIIVATTIITPITIIVIEITEASPAARRIKAPFTATFTALNSTANPIIPVIEWTKGFLTATCSD